MEVTLTPAEIMQGAMVAVMRMTQNIKNGAQHKYGCSDDISWQVNIEGALGELAFAKAANLFWSGSLGDYKADDVAGFQVRTAPRDGLKLILHPEDQDDKIFFLVIGLNGRYRIAGGIMARDGKRPEFWGDPSGKGRPAFFVPEAELYDPKFILPKI